MILRYTIRVGSVIALLIFATLFIFFAGSQPQAYADVPAPGLGNQILCGIVHPDLNEVGSPLPHFSGNCPSSPLPQCSDGVDNDGDGLKDFPADLGCTSADDDTEAPNPPPPACSNGTDDDGDGFTDANDPNCHTDGNPTNTASYNQNGEEPGALPACWNGEDDDGDEKKDFPSDPGWSSATGTSEVDSVTPPQCSNTTDDDGDGVVDTNDPGCHTDFNPSNADSFDPNLNDETAAAPPAAQCADGADTDGDGKTDMADPGCSGASDNDETDPSGGGNEGGNTSGPSSSRGGRSGGGGGSSGGGALPAGTQLFTSTGTSTGATAPSTGLVLGFSTTTESCDLYLTAFIREGRENDTDQVKRLQRFLRDYESAKVDENGVYDTPTLGAVHAFQTKYAADILAPWGIGKSTGYVYLTTRKKVNEIFCNYTRTFLLTTDELQKIEKARAAGIQVPLSPAAPSQPTTPKAPAKPKIPTLSTGTPAVGTTSPPGGVRFDLQGALQFFRGVFDRLR